jgi:hypothetical protein
MHLGQEKDMGTGSRGLLRTVTFTPSHGPGTDLPTSPHLGLCVPLQRYPCLVPSFVSPGPADNLRGSGRSGEEESVGAEIQDGHTCEAHFRLRHLGENTQSNSQVSWSMSKAMLYS